LKIFFATFNNANKNKNPKFNFKRKAKRKSFFFKLTPSAKKEKLGNGFFYLAYCNFYTLFNCYYIFPKKPLLIFKPNTIAQGIIN